MKLKLKTTVSSGLLILRVINIHGSTILKMLENQEAEVLVVPGQEYSLEWFTWSGKPSEIKILVNLQPHHPDFADIVIEQSYEAPHQSPPQTYPEIIIPKH
jgi:hypothetical protein